MNRRNFIKISTALFCAPAIVRADSLMKIWVPPERTIYVLGFKTIEDGGGGAFYFDPDEDESRHNGGTIIDPNHTSVVRMDELFNIQGRFLSGN